MFNHWAWHNLRERGEKREGDQQGPGWSSELGLLINSCYWPAWWLFYSQWWWRWSVALHSTFNDPQSAEREDQVLCRFVPVCSFDALGTHHIRFNVIQIHVFNFLPAMLKLRLWTAVCVSVCVSVISRTLDLGITTPAGSPIQQPAAPLHLHLPAST